MPGFPMLAGNLVMIMWVPVPGAVKYKILMNGKEAGEAAAPPFQVAAPDAAGEYAFTLVAVDASGKSSPPSRGGIVKVIKITPPEGLSVTGVNQRIAISWSPVPGAMIYNVFRSEKSGADHKLLRSVDDTRLIDPDAATNKRYFYVVTARDISGKESGYSKEVSFELKPRAAAAKEEKIAVVVKKTRFVGEIEPMGSAARLQVPVDIAVGPEGKMFVADSSADCVKVIDRGGEVLRYLRPSGAVDARLPFGLGIDSAGDVYVAFAGGAKVVKFSGSDGSQLLAFAVTPSTVKWNLEKMPPEVIGRPPAITDVATLSDGRIVVTDQMYGRIVVHGADGKYQAEFGRRGSETDNFGNPLTIAVDRNDNIYVGDAVNKRVAKISKDLKFVAAVGNPPGNGGSFLGIRGLAFNKEGNLVVSDPPMSAVQAIDVEKMEYLYHYGGEDGATTPDGMRAGWEISNPSGIAFLPSGNLLMVQPKNKNVMEREVLK